MSGILWLASYPKSGNTWLRVFLANLFANSSKPFDINALSRHFYGEMSADLYEKVAGKPLAALDDAALHRLRPKVHRLIASLRRDTVFVKTHNAIAVWNEVPMITPEFTAGAIYVIRNPLDVSVSYADHYGIAIADAVEAMCSPENRILTQPQSVFQYLGDWSSHVLSWCEAPGLKRHIVRYEDMLDDPNAAFAAIAGFLGVDAPRARLRRAIRFSTFEEVKKQERRHGFREKSRSSEAFFRAGRAEQWRQALSPARVERLVQAHREVMQRFDYLP